jgi:hypothetical protein
MCACSSQSRTDRTIQRPNLTGSAVSLVGAHPWHSRT